MHLQAEHWQRHANALMVNTAAYRECGKTKRRTGRCTVQRQLLSDRTAHVCRARFSKQQLERFPTQKIMEGAAWEAPCALTIFGKCAELFVFSMRHATDQREAVPPRHAGTESLLSFAQLDAQHSSGNGPLSQGALGVSSRPGSSAPNGPEAGPA